MSNVPIMFVKFIQAYTSDTHSILNHILKFCCYCKPHTTNGKGVYTINYDDLRVELNIIIDLNKKTDLITIFSCIPTDYLLEVNLCFDY